MNKWQSHFMAVAETTAKLSKDPSTKVGAVAVLDRRIISTGYNGLPATVTDKVSRLEHRETKLLMTVHAEANCVADAARRGVSLNGAEIYITHPSCPHCAGLLIQAGVAKVYNPPASREFLMRWAEPLRIAQEMFTESGVTTMELH
jgi:dCMP deaminase